MYMLVAEILEGFLMCYLIFGLSLLFGISVA